MVNVLQALVIAVISFWSLSSAAAVIPTSRLLCQPLQTTLHTESQLDLEYWQQLHDIYKQQRSLSRFMPVNVSSTEDMSSFTTKWVQHISEVLQNEDLKGSGLASAAETLDSSVETKISGVKFSFKPIEGEARLEWNGFMNGKVRVQALEQTIALELTRALSRTSQVVVSHSKLHSETLQKVAFNYSF